MGVSADGRRAVLAIRARTERAARRKAKPRARMLWPDAGAVTVEWCYRLLLGTSIVPTYWSYRRRNAAARNRIAAITARRAVTRTSWE